jgi:hypothetical protein
MNNNKPFDFITDEEMSSAALGLLKLLLDEGVAGNAGDRVAFKVYEDFINPLYTHDAIGIELKSQAAVDYQDGVATLRLDLGSECLKWYEPTGSWENSMLTASGIVHSGIWTREVRFVHSLQMKFRHGHVHVQFFDRTLGQNVYLDFYSRKTTGSQER